MKNIILAVVLFLNIAYVFAQDNLHPTPLRFTYKSIFSGSDTTAPLSIKQFPQNEFIRGWQWSGRDKITEAMHSNMEQGNSFPITSFTSTKKLNIIPGLGGVPFETIFFQLEPTLKIITPGQFDHRPNDKEHSIFGFGTVLAETIITDTNNINFNRLVLKPTGNYKDSVVLKEAWYIEPYKFIDNDSTQYRARNGQHYFLTLNLRRLNRSIIHETDSAILSIRMPYRLLGDTTLRYAKFAGLPDTNQILRIDSNGFRGHAYDTMLIATANQTTTFTITQNMLPKATDSIGNDVTISAYMIFDGVVPNNNPRFLNYGTGSADEINNIDIEVTYRGVDSIAIDYIRFENPNAQKLLRGDFDTTGSASIRSITQQQLTYFDTASNRRLFRLYANDGNDSPVPWRWGMIQYLNRLLGGLVTGSMPQICGASIPYYTEGVDRWTTHLGPGRATVMVAAPFVRPRNEYVGNSDPIHGYHYYGYNDRSGYRGFVGYWDSCYNVANTGTVRHGDSLSSCYETWLEGWGIHGDNWFLNTDSTVLSRLRNETVDLYINAIAEHTQAFQPKWELQLYQNFAAPQESPFLYYNQPWWSQLFIVSNWSFRENDTNTSTYYDRAYTSSVRPPTGEETRLAAFTAVAMGAKGIAIDRQSSYASAADTASHTARANMANLGFIAVGVTCDNNDRNDTSSLTGLDYLKSDWLGSDFLQHNEPNLLDQYINFDTLAYWIETRPDRIFMGRKSQRLELTKLYTWIDAFNDTLMHLRFAGWFSKGFKDWGNWDTARFGGTNILNKYIKADSAIVRKIYEPKTKSSPTQNEPRDSSFYHITMLAHQDDSTMDKGCYISVINRRTDPLIYAFDTLSGVVDSSMKFYTTAEYDDFVEHGGRRIDSVWKDTSYWRDQWWKRLGCRQISIPFNYKDSNGKYALLRVKEVGGRNSYLDSIYPIRLNTHLYPAIDTVIGQDCFVTLKLLPGEGKLLKVEVLRPNEVAGELAFSNQTKICAYPIMRREYDSTGKWLETDTIVHYMTYHKQIPSRGIGWTGVYFRKSKPASKHDNAAAIQWDNTEYLVSDSIFHDTTWNICDTCAYPSIVTRFDSLSSEYRSYIVYGCYSDINGGKSYNVQYIVESVVRVANDTVVIGNLQGKAFEIAANRNLADWGTVMVNASDTVNFYCWCDPYSGIRAGWKRPSSTPVSLEEAPLNIHWSIGCFGGYSAQHPSMNPYSRYMKGERENEAALVWQEYAGCAGGYKQIFYTRLRLEDGNLEYGLSPVFYSDTSLIDSVFFNGDTSILYVSSHANQSLYSNTFPVVYRDLYISETDTMVCNYEAYYPGMSVSGNKFDKVYWQSENFVFSATGMIKNRLIWFTDTVAGGKYFPYRFSVAPTNLLWSTSGRFLDQPVISAGEWYDAYHPVYFWGDLVNCFNVNERALNFNFRSRPVSLSGGFPSIVTIHDSLALIHHFPQFLHFDAFDATVSIIDKGRLSNAHLVERGSLVSNDWQRNHRIYNRQDAYYVNPRPAPTIRSSGQYFFRASGEQSIARKFYSFGDDSLSFGVSSVIVGEEEYPLKDNPLTSLIDVMKAPDTLSTEWFNVDNIETMDVITTGSTPDRLSAWLERQSDGATWEVTLTAGEQLKITQETVELINGDEEKYRVRICSHNDAVYHPETAISDDEETSYGKSNGKGYSHIDLGNSDPTQTVFIYPNPAREEVNLTIKGTERSEVIIVSAIGGEVVRMTIEGGKTVTVDASGFSSGVYVARVRRVGMADAVVPFVVVK